MKKRGQVTIFIIAGIVVIAVIGLFLFFRQDLIPRTGEKIEENPGSFLEICIEDKLMDGVELISSRGGYLENSLHKTYDDKNISYLCYNQNNYFPCVVQEPMLIQHLKAEVKDYVLDDVRECFENLVSSLDRRGYVVDAVYEGFDVELSSRKITINIDAELTLTKSGETSKKEDFAIIFPTRFYDLAVVVQEIMSQEAEYCNFNQLGYMLVEPNIKIEKKSLGDSTIIYHLTHKKTREEFWFATRSCALPGGL